MLVWDDDPRTPLVMRDSAARPTAAVLLLHGGREIGTAAPPPWSLAALRMRPFAGALTRATREHGVAVGRVRYRCRGWNGACEDPVRDARQALDTLAQRFGDVPTVLVGHSMGGRAALRAAGHPSVRGVVGLAPWCPPGEPVAQLAGRRVVLLHGEMDRVTDPRASAELAARAGDAGADVSMVRLRGADHAMLRRARLWHSLTTDVVSALLGIGPEPAVMARNSGFGGLHQREY